LVCCTKKNLATLVPPSGGPMLNNLKDRAVDFSKGSKAAQSKSVL
jgi:hypothetical protein